ncbi:DUF6233 domain-containing protein [Streptomyces sp. A5-4]|uniref:DUF6233 domain-containing protein n=1 Tax=Streptomyces sp. A5-4 TaxID=3384771 RepID=UPI003DA85E29
MRRSSRVVEWRRMSGAEIPLVAAPQPRIGYLVDERPPWSRTAVLCLTDCPVSGEALSAIRADEARVALTGPGFVPCPRCRPDSEPGIDVP